MGVCGGASTSTVVRKAPTIAISWYVVRGQDKDKDKDEMTVVERRILPGRGYTRRCATRPRASCRSWKHRHSILQELSLGVNPEVAMVAR